MAVIDFQRAKRLRQIQSCQLALEINATLRPGMELPGPLLQMLSWIERNGWVEGTRSGRVGYLCPRANLGHGLVDPSRAGGTFIHFGAEDSEGLADWFAAPDPEVIARLCVFAEVNGDGSRIALWLDDDGSQKIVLMGSGSGCATMCVLADNAVDFLRLVAIGYDSIDGEDFDKLPAEVDPAFPVYPNLAFRAWVERTFAVAIPARGSEIVRHAHSRRADDSPDPFWQWSRRMARSHVATVVAAMPA